MSNKRKPQRLADLSDAKQKKYHERLNLCGYDELSPEEIMKEAGRLAFELYSVKADKKLEMGGYNNTIKDLEERLEVLRILKDEMRAPPPRLVEGKQ